MTVESQNNNDVFPQKRKFVLKCLKCEEEIINQITLKNVERQDAFGKYLDHELKEELETVFHSKWINKHENWIVNSYTVKCVECSESEDYCCTKSDFELKMFDIYHKDSAGEDCNGERVIVNLLQDVSEICDGKLTICQDEVGVGVGVPDTNEILCQLIDKMSSLEEFVLNLRQEIVDLRSDIQKSVENQEIIFKTIGCKDKAKIYTDNKMTLVVNRAMEISNQYGGKSVVINSVSAMPEEDDTTYVFYETPENVVKLKIKKGCKLSVSYDKMEYNPKYDNVKLVKHQILKVE